MQSIYIYYYNVPYLRGKNTNIFSFIGCNVSSISMTDCGERGKSKPDLLSNTHTQTLMGYIIFKMKTFDIADGLN